MELQMKPKRHLGLRIKFPYLLTDRKEICTLCKAYIETERYEFLGKVLQFKPRCSRRGTFLHQYSVINFIPIETKHASFIAHAWRVRDLHFQEKHSNESRDTAEKARCSIRKVAKQGFPTRTRKPDPTIA